MPSTSRAEYWYVSAWESGSPSSLHSMFTRSSGSLKSSLDVEKQTEPHSRSWCVSNCTWTREWSVHVSNVLVTVKLDHTWWSSDDPAVRSVLFRVPGRINKYATYFIRPGQTTVIHVQTFTLRSTSWWSDYEFVKWKNKLNWLNNIYMRSWSEHGSVPKLELLT